MAQSKFLRNALRMIKENPEVFEALEEYDRTGRLPTVQEIKRIKNYTPG